MPGPPPPSPSYNLVLDTSSDEETMTTRRMGDDGLPPENTTMRIRNSTTADIPLSKKTLIEDDDAADDGIRIRNGTTTIVEDDAMRIRNSKERNNDFVSLSEVDLKSLRCDDQSDPIEDDADDEEDSFGDGGCGGVVDVASAVVESIGQPVSNATGGIGGGNASKKKKKKKGKKKKSKKKKKKVVPLVEAEEAAPVADDNVSSAAVLPEEAGINATATDATVDAANNNQKAAATTVTFGSMSVREYKRCMGTDVVPVDGGWPLGLSYDVANEYDVMGGVDAFEERKQNELRRRYVEVMTNKIHKLHKYKKEQQEHGHNGRHHNRRQRGKSIASEDDLAATEEEKKESAAASGHEAKIHIPVPEGVLETRQYDYKSKRSIDVKSILRSEDHDIDVLDDGRNPLFGALCEDERHKLLLRDTESTSSSTSPIDKDDSSGKDSNHGGHKQHNSKNCNNKHNGGNNKKANQQQQQQRKKQRSNSNADQHQNYICPSANEVYNTTEIKHVRNELEQIRNHRTGEGSSGCTCRKLHIHLPNHSGGGSGGSKRNSHRRMPERRVKDELRKRHLLKSNNTKKLSRDEMEKMLFDAVESEPCCWGTDCPCVRDGINCQLDSCSCWHPSHNDTSSNRSSSSSSSSSSSTSSGNSNDDATKKKAEGTGNIGVEGGTSEQGGNDLIKRRCGNKFGMYAVDFEHIGQYRSQFLTNNKDSVELKVDDK